MSESMPPPCEAEIIQDEASLGFFVAQIDCGKCRFQSDVFVVGNTTEGKEIADARTQTAQRIFAEHCRRQRFIKKTSHLPRS